MASTGIDSVVLAADGCDDGVYEYDKTTLLLMEDEVLAQGWFAAGHAVPDMEDYGGGCFYGAHA